MNAWMRGLALLPLALLALGEVGGSRHEVAPATADQAAAPVGAPLRRDPPDAHAGAPSRRDQIPANADFPPQADQGDSEGLTLSAAERQRLGIVTAPLAAAPSAGTHPALGVVLDPQPLFQLLADLASARAAERASSAVLARTRQLHAAEGNASTQELEQAQSTATQDSARVRLLTRQLQSQWGGPLAADGNEALADALAAGDQILLRIDSELVFGDPRLPAAAAWPLDGRHPPLPLGTLWPAPIQDPMSPGRSFLALAERAPGLRPGAHGRVQLSLPGDAAAALLLPRSALVMAQGQGYAYIDTGDGHYQRRLVDLSRALNSGYLIDAGYAAGEPVVVHGAGLLLAAELGSSEDDED